MANHPTNPCRECDHHLAGYSKDARCCEVCMKKFAYLRALDCYLCNAVNVHEEYSVNVTRRDVEKWWARITG